MMMMKMEKSQFVKRLDCLYRQGLACRANWSNWIRRDRLTLQAIRDGWLDEGLVNEKEVKGFDHYTTLQEGKRRLYPTLCEAFLDSAKALFVSSLR